MKNNILHYPRRKNGDKSQEKNIMYFITHECGKRILHERDAFEYSFHLEDTANSCVLPSFPGGEIIEVVELACQTGSRQELRYAEGSSWLKPAGTGLEVGRLCKVILMHEASLAVCLLRTWLFGGKGCSHSLALARRGALLAHP